jgi:hypothetical protein
VGATLPRRGGASESGRMSKTATKRPAYRGDGMSGNALVPRIMGAEADFRDCVSSGADVEDAFIALN